MRDDSRQVRFFRGVDNGIRSMTLEIRGNRLVCPVCGANVTYKGKMYRHGCKPRKRGLGDRLERILKAVGITEERYKELKQMAGWKPDCACPQRKYFLNRITKRVTIGYIKGGFTGALEAAKELANETREHFAKPR